VVLNQDFLMKKCEKIAKVTSLLEDHKQALGEKISKIFFIK
jgi:hypothetical protein